MHSKLLNPLHGGIGVGEGFGIWLELANSARTKLPSTSLLTMLSINLNYAI
jgi:hypothetical protein